MTCPRDYDSRFIRDNIEDRMFNKFCKKCENLYHENGKIKCAYVENPYINEEKSFDEIINNNYSLLLGGMDVTND